jgi:hypothetical protein
MAAWAVKMGVQMHGFFLGRFIFGIFFERKCAVFRCGFRGLQCDALNIE